MPPATRSPECRRETDGLAPWVAEARSTWAVRWVWNDCRRVVPGTALLRRTSGPLPRSATVSRDPARVRARRACRRAPRCDGMGPPHRRSRRPPRRLPSSSWTTPWRRWVPPTGLPDVIAEFLRQRRVIEESTASGRLRLLIAAESAGALVAYELRAAGLPWDAAAHDALLTEILGDVPRAGDCRQGCAALADRIRAELGDPAASLDSQPKLLRALHRVGRARGVDEPMGACRARASGRSRPSSSTRSSRACSRANGWAWLEEWVHDGRFRPVYMPGGVVTGRWASSGGGALQLPRQLRAAVRADPGWALVVADVAQLEPRVLAAMASDGAGGGGTRTRSLRRHRRQRRGGDAREAKVAILGAMYGATTGEQRSARAAPAARLSRERWAWWTTLRARARTAESSRHGSAAARRRRRRAGATRSRVRPRPRHPEPTRPRAPLGARSRSLHAELRRAGNGGGVVAGMARRPARTPRRAVPEVRRGAPRTPRLRRRVSRARGRTWRSSCMTR